MKQHKRKLTLSHLGRNDSYSTRASSLSLTMENQSTIHYAQLQVIEEMLHESERTSLSKSGQEGLYDDEKHNGSLCGQYVISIRDTQHIIRLQNSEQSLLQALLMQHVPVMYQDDVDLHGLSNCIPIILDYFSQNPNDGTQSQEILSFAYLLQMRKSMKDTLRLSKQGSQIVSNRSSDNTPLRRVARRNKSADSTNKQARTGSRVLTVLNIDQTAISDSNETPLREIHETMNHQFQETIIGQGNVQVKECCLTKQCHHKSRIHKITLQALLQISLSSENQYYFGVLVCCYEKLFRSHTEFLKEVIRYYYSKKDSYEYQSTIIDYISLWLEYRQIDLIANTENFCTIIQCFIQIALLINYGKSLNVEQKLIHLASNVVKLGELKKQKLALSLQTQTKMTRRKSDEFTSKLKHHRKLLSFQATNLQKLPKQMKSFTFDDWKFYIEIPLIVLQRQLWIIDVQLYQSISITDLLQAGCLSRQSSNICLKEIADQFDYLLFHLICCTIFCPPQQLSQLFSKFIELYTLAYEAQHYQLTYLLQNYFNHDIVQARLDKNQHLNLLNQQSLLAMQHNEQNRVIPDIDFNLEYATIPCLSQIHLHIYRLSQIEPDDMVQFSRLECLAQQLFQLALMQVQFRKINCGIYRQEPYHTFLSSTFQTNLINLMKCEKRQIEISLYALHNRNKL